MSGIVTKQDNYIINKQIKNVKFFMCNDKRYNHYLIDNMYTLAFTNKQFLETTKQLRWHGSYRMFINFKYDTNMYQWEDIYNHFMSHYNDFNLLKSKKYIHEMFTSNTPTRMFFDLDFKNVSEKTVESYILSLISKLSSYVNLKLEYIITRNNDSSLSRHIIITNLILPDIMQCKVLASKFKDDYIDIQPYRNNASLRVFNGIKITDSGCEKTKVFESSNYIINNNESYLIQPGNIISNYNIPNYQNVESYKYVELQDDSLAGIDLTPYGLIVYDRVEGTNLFRLHKVEQRECPVCNRTHDKSDTNYLVVSNTCVKIRCFRGEGFVKVKSKKFKLDEFLQKIDAINYNYLESNDKIKCDKYIQPNAKMPEIINGDVLYLVSPCKSSKTTIMHEYLSREENANKSICFITMQTKFTRNLSERFKDLGFSCYLDQGFDPKHNKIIISLYSLHRLNDIHQFDIIVIDEIESLLINFCSVGTLGKENRKENLRKYTQLINNTPLTIIMDAYPSQYCMDHFNTFNKKIHVYMNEYKTHKDDKIIIVDNHSSFINYMAEALSKGQNIVFASALKNEQIEIINKVYDILSNLYNIDPTTLESRLYNGDLDKKLMDDSIKNIDNDWYVNLLCYSPSITAGISFEQTHFDKVFYLGYPNSSHISALQALYRVRDVCTREYYITFSRSYSIKSQLYAENDIKNLSDFNRYDNIKLLDYDVLHNDFGSEIRLANSVSNKLLEISDQYLMDSQKNYYRKLIGQFKYNGSEIVFESGELKPMQSYDNITADDITDFFKSNNVNDYYKHIRTSHYSKIDIKNEDYTNPLNDEDYEKLYNKVNKSLQEEQICEINTYLRMFPNFNKEKHSIVSSSPAKYYRYYRSYKNYSKYVNEDLDVFTHFKKTKADPILINDEPLNRFRMQVASKFLQRLLICDTLNYEELHNAEYKDFSIEEIIDALQYLEEDVFKHNKIYIDIFMREFYGNTLYKKKMPIQNISTWKEASNIVNNIIDGSFNLVSNVKYRGKGSNKTSLISFIRPVELF